MKINTNMSINKAKKVIPSIITGFRLVLAFVFLYLLINNQIILSILIFVIAVGTDALDGYLARKFNAFSKFGGYLDTVADFILVLLSFAAFAVLGVYPYWILAIILFMFSQFIITSRSQKPVYDPLGKYYGGFLFLIILLSLLTLLSPNSNIFSIFTILIVIFTLISIISRIYFLMRQKNNLNE